MTDKEKYEQAREVIAKYIFAHGKPLDWTKWEALKNKTIYYDSQFHSLPS
jgi:hypothetical protein